MIIQRVRTPQVPIPSGPAHDHYMGVDTGAAGAAFAAPIISAGALIYYIGKGYFLTGCSEKGYQFPDTLFRVRFAVLF